MTTPSVRALEPPRRARVDSDGVEPITGSAEAPQRDRSGTAHHRENSEEVTARAAVDELIASNPPAAGLASSLDTFPKLVVRNAEQHGDRVAIREKDYGIWQSYTWRQYLAEARLIAFGLAS